MTARRRSARAASDSAPIKSAPRSGGLHADGETEDKAGEEASFAFMTASGIAVWGSTPTVTERLPFPVSLWGMYSSSTRWKLVPPKPKALTPARRGVSAETVQGFSSVLTYSGEGGEKIAAGESVYRT